MNEKIVSLHIKELKSIPEIRKIYNLSYDHVKKILIDEIGYILTAEDIKYLKLKSLCSKEQLEYLHYEELILFTHIKNKFKTSEKLLKRLFEEYDLEIRKIEPKTLERLRVFKKLEKDIDKIKSLSNDYRVTLGDISDKFKCTHTMMKLFLKENGIVLSSSVEGRKLRFDDLINNFRKYCEENTLEEISDITGIGTDAIRKISNDTGIFPKKNPKETISDKLKEDVIAMYTDLNEDSYSIASKLGISQYTAWKILSDAGVSETKSKRIWENTKTDIHKYIFEDKLSVSAISSIVGIGADSLSRYVKSEFGLSEIPNFTKSSSELEIEKYVTDVLGLEVITNTRSIIWPYEIDIFVPSLNTGIEFHGLYWHRTKSREDEKRHYLKWKLCHEKGIRLVQIFSDEWDQKRDLVQRKLAHILGKSTEKKVYARQTEIREIDSNIASEFTEKNHIQGKGKGTIHLGCFLGDELVGVSSIVKYKSGKFKIDRYSTSCSLVGGFSKMLKYFERNYSPKIIETFADLRWSSIDSNLYETTGFKLDSISPPNYFYTIDYKTRESRQKYMKHKLPNLFENVDMTKTEKEIMKNLGYSMIHDAGNLKYVKVLKHID